MRIAGPRSTVVLSGVDTPQRFEWSPHYFKEVNLVGSNAFGVEEWNGVRKHAMEHYFDLIRSKQIDVTPIITHRFPLEEYKEAFRYNAQPGRDGRGEGAVRVSELIQPAETRRRGDNDFSGFGPLRLRVLCGEVSSTRRGTSAAASRGTPRPPRRGRRCGRDSRARSASKRSCDFEACLPGPGRAPGASA